MSFKTESGMFFDLFLVSYNPGVLFSGTWQREVKGLAIPKSPKSIVYL